MNVEKHIMQFVQLAAIAIVAISCYQVLRLFIPAILFAIIVCISTWHLYLRLRRVLRGKSTVAALLMVLLLVVLLIGPSTFLALSLADSVTKLINVIKIILERGPIDPPLWLIETPLFGVRLDKYWHGVASGGAEAVALLKDLLEPMRDIFLGVAKEMGQGLLQMAFACFIGFFFYRDGEAMVQTLRNGMTRLVGNLSEELLITVHQTVISVVQGLFGTALAQATVAMAGFFIAGVPGAILLGTATFFLSLIPIGPPLVWGGASIWLLYHGSYGWAIFMILWGVFAISSIDNVVKPYLISRGSKLPMLLIVLGVFGGIFAFGIIGVFIGPVILAVGMTLVRLWAAARTVPDTETLR